MSRGHYIHFPWLLQQMVINWWLQTIEMWSLFRRPDQKLRVSATGRIPAPAAQPGRAPCGASPHLSCRQKPSLSRGCVTPASASSPGPSCRDRRQGGTPGKPPRLVSKPFIGPSGQRPLPLEETGTGFGMRPLSVYTTCQPRLRS